MVLTFINEKGGVGKTTLATNLACTYSTMGKSVVLVDADPQGTATDWFEARDGPVKLNLSLLSAPDGSLENNVPRLSRERDVTLIDTPGSLSTVTVQAIRKSDVALLPVQPSAADLWAVQDAVSLIEERRKVEGSPLARFIVSAGKVGTRLTSEAGDALESFPLDFLDARTHNREAYKRALGSGESVIEISGAKKAEKEVSSIAKEVLGLYSNQSTLEDA